MAEPMPQEDVREALRGLPGWDLGEGALTRELRFGSFSEALAFVVRVGLEAERRDHHPEIWNSYDRVRLSLVSHDAGGVTERDLELARAIDGMVG